MDALITFCGQYLIILPVLMTAYLLYKLDTKLKKQYLLLVIAGGLLALVLALVASHFYSNPRPFLSDGVTPKFSSATDNGFPSDHTLLAAVLAFASLVYSRKLGVLLLVVAVLVAWGRVAGGVHHGVDVIASFALAGLAVLITKNLLARSLPQKLKDA